MMSDSHPPNTHDTDMEEMEAAAVDWFVRLHAPDTTPEDRREHAEWLAANPAHRERYDAVEDAWQDLDGLESRARDELDRLYPKVGRRVTRPAALWLGGLATAAAVMLVAVLTWYEPTVYFETAKAEQRQVSLEDGSRLHLNTASVLAVRFTPDVREVSLSKGETLFDVNHDERRPFVVRAGGSNVIAIGTRFAVYLDGDKLTVTVLEGRVAVVSAGVDIADAVVEGGTRITPGPNRVFLEADRQAHLDIGGVVETLQQVNAANVTAWQEGKLVFDSAPLREVVRELSRYTPGDIRVAGDVPDHPVTGIIQIRSAEAMCHLLAQVVPVVPVSESARLTVLYPAS